MEQLATGGLREAEVDLRLMQHPLEKAPRREAPMTNDGLCASGCPCIHCKIFVLFPIAGVVLIDLHRDAFATEAEDIIERVPLPFDAIGNDVSYSSNWQEDWRSYWRIAMVLVKNVRAVTWPISHLL